MVFGAVARVFQQQTNDAQFNYLSAAQKTTISSESPSSAASKGASGVTEILEGGDKSKEVRGGKIYVCV